LPGRLEVRPRAALVIELFNQTALAPGSVPTISGTRDCRAGTWFLTCRPVTPVRNRRLGSRCRLRLASGDVGCLLGIRLEVVCGSDVFAGHGFAVGGL